MHPLRTSPKNHPASTRASSFRYCTSRMHLTAKVLTLCESPDSRERTFLRDILYRLYHRFVSLRKAIRTAMSNFFLRYAFYRHALTSRHVYEDTAPYGIAELLEIMGTIVNGFAVPL